MSDHQLIPAYLPAFAHPYYSEPNAFYGGQVLGVLDREIQQEAACAFDYTEYHDEAIGLIAAEVREMLAGNKGVDQAIADAAEAIREMVNSE